MGGVYAIQQFAMHLSSVMRVNLVVRRGDPQPVPGVSVHSSETLRSDSLPDSDAIVLGLNQTNCEAFFRLPESKGERVFLFQGYNKLDDPMVRERLTLGFRVLAVSRWLVEEARRFGAPAVHTPYGLDRAFFFAGSPPEKRDNVVSMMSNPTYWKGAPDGIAALTEVKDARPKTKFLLFGHEPPAFRCSFIPHPSRAEVGSLLRQSAVFVCPSWEEGVGMPGLEALACGAALATTDTKGSRDYAIHGETALVSAPRRPDLLAESILTLLDDLELRRALYGNGIEYARTHFKPWPEAAKAMGAALISS